MCGRRVLIASVVQVLPTYRHKDARERLPCNAKSIYFGIVDDDDDYDDNNHSASAY